MKKTFLLIILLTSVGIVFSQDVALQGTASMAEYDWNNDGLLDQFIFYHIQSDYIPADFLKFQINISGVKTYDFNSVDSAWVKWSTDASYSPVEFLKSNNLLKTDYAALLDVKSNKKSNPFLFLFGFAPLNEPGILDIFCLNNKNEPIRIYSEKADLNNIVDIDNDGSSEIVLSPNHEYCENYYKEYHYSTYEPYYVYRVSKNNKLKFDTKLTAIYNKKHYVGWVGLDKTHNYIIWDDPVTKKRILTTLPEAIKKYFK